MRFLSLNPGPWIQTYSGFAFHPEAPWVGEIAIQDIAHALALENRFGGHTKEPYSVAQHSVIVSQIVNGTGYELEGLLHDATEAYLKDIPKPLKDCLGPDYKRMEKNLAHEIGAQFGVDLVNLPEEVKEADRVALATEKRDLLSQPLVEGYVWDPRGLLEPLGVVIEPWSWQTAEREFLTRYWELTADD